MLAATAFILFFVLVGAGVLFLAFGGGARRTATSVAGGGGSGGRAARRTTGAVVALVVLAFGIAIPVFSLIHNNDAQSRQATGGLDLTAQQQHGRELFAKNCATCHTLDAANSVGKVGPNLDKLRPPAALVVNAVEQGRARGQGQMPAALLTGDDVKLVADFVSKAAGR